MVVEAERDVHAIGGAIGDHRRGPFEHFLGRLEDQPHRAGELRGEILQHRRDAEQRRGVDVVPAGVHLAIDG